MVWGLEGIEAFGLGGVVGLLGRFTTIGSGPGAGSAARLCPDGQDIVPFLCPAAGCVSVRSDQAPDYVLSLGTGRMPRGGVDR